MQNGMKESEIVELFGGDMQLVMLWRSFIIHNKWINKSPTTDGKWEITNKGKEMVKKYGSRICLTE